MEMKSGESHSSISKFRLAGENIRGINFLGLSNLVKVWGKYSSILLTAFLPEVTFFFLHTFYTSQKMHMQLADSLIGYAANLRESKNYFVQRRGNM